MAVRFVPGGLISYDPAKGNALEKAIEEKKRQTISGGGGGDSQPVSLKLTEEEIEARKNSEAKEELERKIEADRKRKADEIVRQRNAEIIRSKNQAERNKIQLDALRRLEQLKLAKAEAISRINPNISKKGSYEEIQKQANRVKNIKEIKDISSQLVNGDVLIYRDDTYEITGIRSKKTQKSYPWTERGVQEYNRDLESVRIGVNEYLETQVEAKRKEPKQKDSGLNQLRQTYVKIKANADMDSLKYKREVDRLLKQGKKLNNPELRNATSLLNRANRRKNESLAALRIIDTIDGAKLIPEILKTISNELYQTKFLSLIPITLTGQDRLDLSKVYQRQGVPQFKFKNSAINLLTVDLAKGIVNDWKDTWRLAKISPRQALAKVGTDILLLQSFNNALKVVGKLTGKVTRRLNPKFKSFESGIITLKVPKEIFERRGKEIYLTRRVGKFRTPIDILKGRKTGQFKKFQKTPGIKLELGVIGKGVSLKDQLKFAGKRGTITTAQADGLVNFLLGRNRVIRKPIPGEATFTALTKRLLQKFDEGKLTKKEFIRLNQRIIVESGGKTLLERSLYADPTGKVRFSRLGSNFNQEATWRDILRGNISFKKQKPQIVVFPQGKIAKFPKSLKDIINKLKKNKPLTELERIRLVKWQTKRGSGQWKPIGDTVYRNGIELEVTLAPGEIIRRVRRLAITEIEGVPVEIIEAKVIKLSKKTSSLLNKAKLGKILKNEIDKLRSLLKRETKINVSANDIKRMSKSIRRRSFSRPRLPINRIIISKGIIKTRQLLKRRGIGRRNVNLKRNIRRNNVRRTSRKNVIRTTPKRKPWARRTPRGGRPKPPIRNPPRRPGRMPPRKKPQNRILRRTLRSPRTKPLVTKKPKTYLKGSSRFNQKTLSKSVPTYYVVEKRRGKFRKLYPKPLTLQDARDYAVYSIDNKLSRTAFFIPLGKRNKVLRPPLKINNYYSRNKIKVRPYRIRYGKKKMLVNGYIEKRKYFRDKPGERKGLKKPRRKRK